MNATGPQPHRELVDNQNDIGDRGETVHWSHFDRRVALPRAMMVFTGAVSATPAVII
jgi:hypothetical protein